MKSGISIIGAGRIGRALGRRLREHGCRIHFVVTQSETTARRAVRSIGGASGVAELSRGLFSASVILIAAPESAMADVVISLARFGENGLRGKTVLQTRIALSSVVLEPLRSFGAAVGSIHPLQASNGIGIPPLDGRMFVIEQDPGALRVARGMTRALGGLPIQLSAAAKPLYHAAAAMSAGHVLALGEAAARIFTPLGIRRREALKAHLPLTRQVLENPERLGPRAAWTGPLARGDYNVTAKHEDALESAPLEYLEAYRAVNHLAARVLARDAHSILTELARSSSKPDSESKVRGASA